MKVVVFEQYIKIGQVFGQDICTWQFRDVIALSELNKWCKNRGYAYKWLDDESGELSSDDLRFYVHIVGGSK